VTKYLLEASAYHMALILDSIAAELEGRGMLAQSAVRNAASVLHAEVRARGDVARAEPRKALDLLAMSDAALGAALDQVPAPGHPDFRGPRSRKPTAE